MARGAVAKTLAEEEVDEWPDKDHVVVDQLTDGGGKEASGVKLTIGDTLTFRYTADGEDRSPINIDPTGASRPVPGFEARQIVDTGRLAAADEEKLKEKDEEVFMQSEILPDRCVDPSVVLDEPLLTGTG
jgi:hypothetical protein